MLGYLKKLITPYLSTLISSTIREEILLSLDEYLEFKQKSGNNLQISQQILFNQYRDISNFPNYLDSGFSAFSQDNEDGILLEIFSKIGFQNKTFIEIGAGNGVFFSNCANLCMNFGFNGLFIESDTQKVSDGISYYENSYRTNLFPPKFCSSFVTKDNINQLITDYNGPKTIDLLSIDIDGNDYWVLKNLDAVVPRVIVLEVNPAFKDQSYTIQYNSNFKLKDPDKDIYGMSVCAAIKLCKSRGYKLVASNSKGFNLFFVLEKISESIPEMDHTLIFNKDYFKSKTNTCDLEGLELVQI